MIFYDFTAAASSTKREYKTSALRGWGLQKPQATPKFYAPGRVTIKHNGQEYGDVAATRGTQE